MEKRLTRGQALAAFGSVGLGALLAGCGGNDGAVAVETAERRHDHRQPRHDGEHRDAGLGGRAPRRHLAAISLDVTS